MPMLFTISTAASASLQHSIQPRQLSGRPTTILNFQPSKGRECEICHHEVRAVETRACSFRRLTACQVCLRAYTVERSLETVCVWTSMSATRRTE